MSKIATKNKISISIINCDHLPWLGFFMMANMLTACGFQTYQAKPIDPQHQQSQYLSRTPDSEAFKQFLLSQNYPVTDWPIQTWGAREITLCALFFHADLNTSRAEWRVAMAEQSTASQRPELGGAGNLGNHSRTEGNISPWTLGIGIDVPIETMGKREARIDRAIQLSEAARLQIGQIAWQVRTRITKSWLAFQYASLQSEPLAQELAIRKSIVAMLEKRLALGIASSVEVANARLALQKTQQQWSLNTGRITELRAKLASDAGLPIGSFNELNMVKIDVTPNTQQLDQLLKQEQAQPNIAPTQQTALLNRLDIRSALARYAASDTKLRLEIAKQYPNITLSPSYTFDQSDHVWSLGFSSLMTLIYKNRGLIEEARALREVEATKFEKLQASVISQLTQSKAMYATAKTAFEQANNYAQSLRERTKKSQRQFDAGQIDRLELASTQLENITATQDMLNAAQQLALAMSDIEDAMQHPIDDTLDISSTIMGNPFSSAADNCRTLGQFISMKTILKTSQKVSGGHES